MKEIVQSLLEDILLKQYLLFNPGASINNKFARIIIENLIIIYCKIDGSDENIEYLINYNYPTPSGKWRYNYGGSGDRATAVGNIRVPTEPYIPFYKLCCEKDNIYDFISSSICVLHPFEFISGERIQSLADVVIGDNETLYNGNPNNDIFSKEMMDMDQPDTVNKIENYTSIFLFTHLLERFYASPLGEKMKGRVLITHNSDDSAADKTNIVKYQFSQNARAVADETRLTGIPIGIENNRWFRYSDIERLVWCDATNARSPIIKTKNVYFYFSFGTHKSRTKTYEILSKKPGLEWNIRRTKREYFEELSRHQYAICPRGNGVDTHRVWESLYLNVIPIVVRVDYIDAFEGLPIIVLDNWDEFDIDTLPKDPVFCGQNFAKLTMSYWAEKIKNAAAAAAANTTTVA